MRVNYVHELCYGINIVWDCVKGVMPYRAGLALQAIPNFNTHPLALPIVHYITYCMYTIEPARDLHWS